MLEVTNDPDFLWFKRIYKKAIENPFGVGTDYAQRYYLDHSTFLFYRASDSGLRPAEGIRRICLRLYFELPVFADVKSKQECKNILGSDFNEWADRLVGVYINISDYKN